MEDAEARFRFWQRWLLVVGIIVTAFGLFIAFFSGTAFFRLFDDNINPAFWGTSDVPDAARDFQKWVYGAWGATVAGWGVFILFIARHPFARREKWAWDCLVWGLSVWFVIDTGWSAYCRVHVNVALNAALLLAALPPLILSRKYFPRPSLGGQA